MSEGSLVRTGLRFLFAWFVVALVSPFWFHPDPTGIVPALGFLLTPFGAMILMYCDFDAKRLGLFFLAYCLLVIPIGISMSLIWSALFRLVTSTSPTATVPRLLVSTFVPLSFVYAFAYWFAYRGGVHRATEWVS